MAVVMAIRLWSHESVGLAPAGEVIIMDMHEGTCISRVSDSNITTTYPSSVSHEPGTIIIYFVRDCLIHLWAVSQQHGGVSSPLDS